MRTSTWPNSATARSIVGSPRLVGVMGTMMSQQQIDA
jgi:hypothetical protein